MVLKWVLSCWGLEPQGIALKFSNWGLRGIIDDVGGTPLAFCHRFSFENLKAMLKARKASAGAPPTPSPMPLYILWVALQHYKMDNTISDARNVSFIISDAFLHFANKMYNTISYVLQYRLKINLLDPKRLSLMLITRVMISQRLSKRYQYLAKDHICRSFLCSCRLLSCIHNFDCNLCHIVFSCKFFSVSFYFSTHKTWDFVKFS